MEEHIEPGRDVDGSRTRLGVEAVDDAERRAQRPVRDASLGEQRLVVEDGGAGWRDQRSLESSGALVSDPVPAVVGIATRRLSTCEISGGLAADDEPC